jgi:hypothetical protein
VPESGYRSFFERYRRPIEVASRRIAAIGVRKPLSPADKGVAAPISAIQQKPSFSIHQPTTLENQDMNPTSYSDRMDAYQTTVENLEADLAKYPGATELYLQLRTLLAELRPAHGSVEAQRGSLRVAVQVRRDLAERSRAIHRRLSALVSAHTGFTNPILVTYGMNPEDNSNRRGRRSLKERKEKEAERLAALQQEMAAQATA